MNTANLPDDCHGDNMNNKLLSACLFFALASGVASAQLPQPNAKGNTAGHHIFTVSNKAVADEFWHALGGKNVEWGVLKMIAFPGAYFYIREGEHSGGTEGSSVDFLGFRVRNLDQALANLLPLGFLPMAGADDSQAFIMGPDQVKIHLVEDTALATFSATDEVRIVGPAGTQAWYEQYFGTGMEGMRLTFTVTDSPVAPTLGRALDRLGIEVTGLQSNVDTLQGSGSQGPDRVVQGGDNFPDRFAIAVFTAPEGTFIEISEGLDQIKVP
jgi:hypothetical protein